MKRPIKVTDHPLYWIWRGIRQRIFDQNCKIFKYYGGKGVFICERWMKFKNFCKDMGPRPSTDHSIERLDSNGPYAPDNCKWATRIEQMNNMSRNHWITFGNERKTIAQWARHFGLRRKLIEARLRKGWSLERVFSPSRKCL